MIEERRCSYEVCKLLHEKGFDIKCTDWYGEDNVYGCTDTTPATKEQRDTLEKEMLKAGYEWDEETKECKKIEQTTEIPFGAKDSELQEVTYHIPNGYHAEINGNAVVIKKGELINDTPSQDRWQEPCKLNPEKDLSNPIDYWQDVRGRAAIAAMQSIIPTQKGKYMLCDAHKMYDDCANEAIKYADALVKKLKGE